ncbi:MAG TPA: EAL domain-containing protein [Roseiarcus sp.]|jgi:diguanylate cyclase (GGDEF)-like protein/PAS domain S-box-containing protein
MASAKSQNPVDPTSRVSYGEARLRNVAGIDADIVRLKHAEEKLQFANTLLTTQMETSPDGILVVDADARIISFNRRFADMWSVSLDLLEAKDDAPVLAAVMSAMKDPQAFVARVKYLYQHPEEGGRDELETRDGRFIDRHTGVLRTPAGDQLGRVWFFRDITERKLAEAEILRTARCDTLTGLANRAVFLEAVQHAIATVRRGAKPFGVLYLDLDQFKDVNDTLGHPIGDELLKAVAVRLKSNTRDVDLVARFGGDEFAVLVCDVGEPANAAIVADTIIKAMAAPFMIVGNDIRCGVSIGISLFGPDEPDTETILSRADVALYRAKSERTGEYRFHTDAMDNEIRTRVTLGAELREGIALEQLFLEYQPQVDIATGRIKGLEALVRWRHPSRGVLGPNLFIPVAEKCGLIASLGHWVLRRACAQAKQWLDGGIAPEAIAVNLSAVQFKRAFELETEIANVLAETGLPPCRLELELTETVLMAASREHNDVLQRLRGSGVRLAIDDFGVGYSSLDYLRRFPATRIKIAQAFVGQIATESGSAAIVKATIGLARELGIAVVAMGVETPAQLDLLKSWGCPGAQGFYFARPLAAEDVAPLLARDRIARGHEILATTAA